MGFTWSTAYLDPCSSFLPVSSNSIFNFIELVGSPCLIFVPRSLVDRSAMTDLIIGLWIPLLIYKINKVGSFGPHYDVDFGSNLAFSNVPFQILPHYDAGIWYGWVESNKDVCYAQMNLVQIEICSPIILKVFSFFALQNIDGFNEGDLKDLCQIEFLVLRFIFKCWQG